VLAGVILAGGVLVLLGAVCNEVVGVSTAKAALLLTTTRLLWNHENWLMISASSPSLSASICFSVTETKEDKTKEACEGLAKEPPVPETKAIVGAEGFSIFARVWWSISADLSLLKSSSMVNVS
jgi:hypothetical protein